MDNPTLSDYEPSDSLSVEQTNPEDGIVGEGIKVRCAYCRMDHSTHLQPVVDSDGKQYPNVYHIEKPLQNAAPVFCIECWEKVEVENNDHNATFADFQ